MSTFLTQKTYPYEYVFHYQILTSSFSSEVTVSAIGSKIAGTFKALISAYQPFIVLFVQLNKKLLDFPITLKAQHIPQRGYKAISNNAVSMTATIYEINFTILYSSNQIKKPYP